MAYTPNYYGGYYQPTYYPNNGAVPDMLNQQKMAYQQPMQMQPMANPTPMQSNDFIWVLSEVEAQSYPVAPNNTVILWDKNTPTIYIKSANAQGVPTLRTLDFTERTPETAQKPSTSPEFDASKYVSREDFNALRGEFDTLRDRFERQPRIYNEPITKEDYD